MCPGADVNFGALADFILAHPEAATVVKIDQSEAAPDSAVNKADAAPPQKRNKPEADGTAADLEVAGQDEVRRAGQRRWWRHTPVASLTLPGT
jgi:hypothetical protein